MKDFNAVVAYLESKAARTPRTPQPGDILALAIKAATGETPCGACLARKKQMNEWGWWGCWKRRDLIGDWLVEEAAKRGHTIDKHHAAPWLHAAWSEVRRRRESNCRTPRESS